MLITDNGSERKNHTSYRRPQSHLPVLRTRQRRKRIQDYHAEILVKTKSSVAKKISEAEHWELAYAGLGDAERELLMVFLPPESLKLQPQHLLYTLWNNQSKGNFEGFFGARIHKFRSLSV